MKNKLPLICLLVALAAAVGGVFFFKQKGFKSTADVTDWINGKAKNEKLAQPEEWVPTVPDKQPDKMPKVEDDFQQGKWYDYATALDLSKKTSKNVYVLFSADWCTWCKKLQKDTFGDSQVKQKMNGYILCYVDTDKQRDIANKYNVSGIPHYVVVGPTGNTVKSGSGYKAPQEFLNWLP